MVSTVDFNVEPYFDDYDPKKKFLRELFRPGFAVQARELTQLQTVLQNQIDRFGSHIFEDGSKVIAADIADQNIQFLRVDPTFGGNDLVAEDFIGFDISSTTDTDLKAFVFHAISVTGDDPYVILFIEYNSTGNNSEFQPTDTLLSANTVTLTEATVKDASVNPNMLVSGPAKLASIDEGIFFVDGFFILNDAQRVAPFRPAVAADSPIPLNVRLFTGINARIGFNIQQDVVTSDDDSSLLDPAFGAPNFNAPGADRLRIELLIDFHLFDDTADAPTDFADPNFVEWMRIRRDITVLQAVRPNYSALENELAQQVQGIHGSFTVRAFNPDIRPHLKNDNFQLDVSAITGTFDLESDSPGNRNVTGGTSGAVGIVDFIANYTSAPTDQMCFLMLSGTFIANETITQDVTGATAVIDTDPVSDGFTEDTKGVFTLAQGGEEDKIAFGLEPGKAFVQGFEFETLATEFVKVDKARDTGAIGNFNISTNFGNYVLVDSNTDTKFEDWDTDFNMDAMPVVNLQDKFLVQVGTARVRQIQRDSSVAYRIYLFDSTFVSGKSMADVRKIEDVLSTLFWNIREPEGVDAATVNREGDSGTILFESEANRLIFPVPVGQATAKFDETDWRSQQSFKITLNASGIASATTGNPKIRFIGGEPVTGSDLNFYTVIDESGNIIDMTAGSNSIFTNNVSQPFTQGTVTLTIPSLANLSVTLIATLDINDDNISDEPLIRRNKVLEKNFEVPTPITLDADVLLTGLDDTFTNTETVTGTTSGATATVDLANEVLVGFLEWTYDTFTGAFDLGETLEVQPVGPGQATAEINCAFILVDAVLTSIGGTFFPGEIVESVSGAKAIALTGTSFRFVFDMFLDGDVLTGTISGATATFNVTGSVYRGAIFDYDVSNTTGVFENFDKVEALSSANIIDISGVFSHRGKILKNVSNGVFVEGEVITGGTSNATATLSSVVQTGAIPLADIFGMVSIFDATGIPVNVTPAFFVDDGQRDNLYDWGSLEYDPQSGIIPITPLTVKVNYFEHTGDGPLYVNSYTHPSSNLRFENIPLYTSPQTGVTVALRDSVDFRPLRNPAGDITKIFLPQTGQAFDADYSFYLSRIDKIILRKERLFDVIRGIPSLDAETPADDPEALTLFVVKLPPYTFNVADIESRYIENKRYTMSDIGDLDLRVQRLEYYTSLTLLERETDALTVLDASGEDRFKNGILVDSFQGHNIGDVLNPDYDVSIDFERKHLRPPFIDRPIELVEEPGTKNTSIAISADGLVTLSFEETNLVLQPSASTAISVNPFNVVNWMGSMRISPSSDTWIDIDQRPEVRINLEGENDAWTATTRAANGAMSNGFGTQWGDWEQNWTGRTLRRRTFQRTSRRTLSAAHASRAPDGVMRRKVEDTRTTIERTVETLEGRETRQGIITRVVPERIERSLGNRIVDVSIVRFIRNQTLVINSEGMKPNTRVFPYFDNVEVTEFCTPDGGSLGADIVTDAAGAVPNLEFEIPAGRFRTGDRLFRLTDEPNNIIANSLTSAENCWTAQGLLQTREEAIISTRIPVLRRQSVTQVRPARDVRTRDRAVDAQTKVRWVDPLAQTFLVDSNLHSNGVFLTSLDLFFKAKDTNIPVTIQIRPVVNGFPHSSAVIPFSEVTLNPTTAIGTGSPAGERGDNPGDGKITDGAIPTSDTPDPSDEDTITRFNFSSPVFLAGGQEYVVVILSNSNEYLTYIAVIGENQLGTEDRISMQPYAGSLFRSQNASTWTPDQTSDLMFVLHRAKFDTANTGTLDYRNVLSTDPNLPAQPSSLPDEAGMNELYLLSSQLEFPDSQLNLSVDTLPATESALVGNFQAILANQQEKFVNPQKILMTTNPATFLLRVQMNSSDDAISPVLDQDRLTAIVIGNRVNNERDTNIANLSYNGELEPSAFVAHDPDISDGNTGPLARYVTRLVTLEPGFESTDLRVFLTVNKQIETEIQVFVKVQPPEEEGDFPDQRYVQLQPLKNVISENDDDFREMQFELPVEFEEPFSKFVVKVTLYSSNSSVVPKVRDLRAIAVI